MVLLELRLSIRAEAVIYQLPDTRKQYYLAVAFFDLLPPVEHQAEFA